MLLKSVITALVCKVIKFQYYIYMYLIMYL